MELIDAAMMWGNQNLLGPLFVAIAFLTVVYLIARAFDK